MKNMRLLLILLLGSVCAFSQTPTYQYRLMNDIQVSSTVYEFDIFLKRTGGTALEVANTQVGLNFNGAIRNGGTLTFSIVAGTSEFLAGQVPTSFSVDTTNKILRIQAKANPGAGNGTVAADTGNGIRFGRFRVTDTAPFTSVTPDLSWNFISTGGKFPSRLSAYVSGTATDVTVPDSHKVNLVNPVLNTSISGQKYNDLNGNGVLDEGEPGLSSWRIRLLQSGSQVDSILTDVNGNYGFPGLASGTYTVSEQSQAGWTQTSSPSSYTIIVVSGTFSANNNFGNFQLGTINGLKFNDADGDSVKDVGETSLSGWRIRLIKDGSQVDSMLTDGSGNYTFSNLTAGTYTISEAIQSGWTQTSPASPGTYTVVVTSGMVATSKDFGNFQYGSINGKKFNDLNGNGVKDVGEGGLSGWKIILSGPVSASIFTDGSGNYSFGNLIAGSYTVSESLQTGWVQSFPSAPGTHVLSVSSGSVYTNKDFGNFQHGAISGIKFHDVNGNGVKEGGESGLSSWRIRLALTGAPFDSALTDGTGNYSFVNLAPGSYTVSELLKSGWTQTAPASPGTYSIQLTSGLTVTGRDFGNFQLASISGTKYNDLDGDASRDPGEPTLSGWKIRLAKSGTQVDSTLTDGSGNYVFNNLSVGTYTISEAIQAGWVQTFPSSPGTHSVSVSSGSAITDKDFGNFHLGSITGLKFNDTDGDGTKDPGEPGVSGWMIRLSFNGSPIDSTTTDVSGNYLFSGLVSGSYVVSEAVVSGWIQTFPVLGIYDVTIASGDSLPGKNFGNFQLGAISGVKFNDLNGNGAKDLGEPSLASWKIRLSKAGLQVDSVLTDGSGHYSFTGLTLGTYVVSEALQNGWIATYPASPGTHTIPITSGTVAANTDFGNFQLGSISGMKYKDVSANGVKDIADPGLASWKIRLSRNGSPVDSMLTDVNGNYTFTNLNVGTYTVSEALQASWFQSAPPVPGTYTINLTTSGSFITARDFGNYQLGSISGMVFDDVNGNGVKDGGEPPLTNWRVRLNGLRVDSALTDGSGNYTFANLVPGTYGISQDVQSGWIQTLPLSQGTYLIALASGTSDANRIFGNFRMTGIAGTKFNDLNGNGVKDAGDLGMSGWRIRLDRNGVRVDSALTDGAGGYLFKDLTAGTYTVSEAQQAGWVQTLPLVPGTYTVLITSGSSASARDFGNFLLGSISGMKFNDINGNGIKDSTEHGLSEWKIRLSGTKVDSVLTDSEGQYTFQNLRAGVYTVNEVQQDGWYQTLPPSDGVYTILISSGTNSQGDDFGNTLVRALYATMKAGWNLISIPLLPENGDMHTNILFPTAATQAFAYDNGYFPSDNLELGVGYWLRFDSLELVSMSGKEVLPETVAVSPGWNLIGAAAKKISTELIGSEPPNILASRFFGFNGSYQPVDTLDPFQGYWVKSDSEGKLLLTPAARVLTSQSKNLSQSGEEEFTTNLNRLSLQDACGNTQTLYFGSEEHIGTRRIDLPPLPPQGTFDARFSNDGMLIAYSTKNHVSNTYNVRIQTERLPLEVTWSIIDQSAQYTLSDDRGGKMFSPQLLRGEGAARIAEPASQLRLTISSVNKLPSEYMLDQNYPNPFNASTNIQYALPATSKVTLTIYNLLGQQVEKLVDEVQLEGYHQVRWTSKIASGIYFYRLDASSMKEEKKSFSRVRKMLIIQ